MLLNALRMSGLIALLLCSACTSESMDTEDSSRITALVERLRSGDPEVRSTAAEELQRLSTSGLTPLEAADALEAARGSFALVDTTFGQQVPQLLVEAASSSPDESLVPVLRASYQDYSGEAKAVALSLLTQIGSEASTTLYVDLALSEARNPSSLNYLPTVGLVRNPIHGDIVFPALLEVMRVPELRWGVAELALEYFQQGAIERGALDDDYAHIDPVLSDLLDRAQRFEPMEESDWMWTNDYQDVRWITGLFLDVSGYFATAESIRNLEVGISLPDPRLKFFAARSLMSLGRGVADDVLYDVAASHEVRNWLYEYLRDSGQIERFPPEFLTQEYFAISDMVNWLVFPTELARAPDEIEVVDVVSAKIDGREFVHYILRFRTDPPHWSAESGWMLGISGPFLVGPAPDPTAWGDTFSTFAKQSETDMDAYVDDVRKLLDEARFR